MRMRRWFVFLLLFVVSAFGATLKLYLKDGTFQVVREYQVVSDRVRYYSTERSDWEEIPLALVDLDRTKKEAAIRQEQIKKDAAEFAAEEKFERQEREEVERVPQQTGVYTVEGAELKTVKQAESKVVSNRRRSVLKAIAPIPIVSGKATIEIDGERSAHMVRGDRPEFYIRLNAEERFGITKLTPKKGSRVLQRLTIIPVSKEVVEEQDEIEVFRRQLGDGLYKIWPVKPLVPGEYAVYEFTPGKTNVQAWDFSYQPAGK